MKSKQEQGGRLKNSIRNTVSGVTYRMLAMIFPFIIRTAIIKKIGMDYAGLNGLFNSVLMMLSISELGFGSALVYSMYRPIAEGDTDKVCALLNLYKKVYRIVGSIILVLGLSIMPFIRLLVNGEVPADVNIYILYFIFLLNTVVSYFMFSYKGAIFTAMQREDISNKIMTCVNLAMYVIQLVVLCLTKNYMAYIILMPVFTVLINIIKAVVANKIYPQFRCRGSIEKAELKEIYKNVAALIGHQINGTLIVSADTVVISFVLGLTAVACYNNYYMIINALRGFFLVLFTAIRPSVGNSIVTESIEKNYKDFCKISSLVLWGAGFCSISMLCLFQPFMRLWVGEKYLLSTETVVMMGIYFFEWKMLDMLILYRDAAGMWWSDRFRPYIISILNLIGNILLIHFFGLEGVVFSTLFTSMCISYPWVLKMLFKEYFKMKPQVYLKQLVWQCGIVVLAAVLTYVFCNYVVTGYSISMFIIRVLVCAVIPNLIFMLTIGRSKNIREIITKLATGHI